MKGRILTLITIMLMLSIAIPNSLSTNMNYAIGNRILNNISSNEIESNKNNDEYCYPCQQRQFFTLIENPNEIRYPVMEVPLTFDNLDKPSPKPNIIDDLPSEFSWKNHQNRDWTTRPRDQGWCGSCWLFGAISSLESIIEIREDCAELNPDLSEQYVMSCLPASAGIYGQACRGGNPYQVFRYIMINSSRGNNVNGIIPELCFKYMGIDASGLDFNQDGFDPVECDEKSEDWMDYIIPIVDCGYWIPDGSEEDILAIKSQVYTTGPVTTCYYVSTDFNIWISSHHDADDYYPYEFSDSTNHCVEIVGWKDDPSIPRGGYWIIKNSWGPYPGYDDGFFNIEYGSLNIDSAIIQWVEYDPELYNWPPQADAGGPYSGSVGETITFDAGNSVDPENEIISYHWDFGDGTNGSGISTTHTYTNSGMYPVTLTITDDIGTVTSDETSITIDFWKEGDFWSYHFDEFDVYTKFDSGGGYMGFDIDCIIENLTFSYESETETSYCLSYEGSLDGDIILEYFGLTPGITIVRNGDINGILTFEKGSLHLQSYSCTLSMFAKPQFGLLRFPIPLPLSLTFHGDFHIPFPSYDFPFKDGKIWDSMSNYITTKVTTESEGFNVLDLVNRIGSAFGVPLFNPDGGIISMNVKNNRFTSTDLESVSVPKGTYDAYKISFANFIDYYYSPEVNNMVKMHAETGDFLSPYWDLNFRINGELFETNR